MFQVLRNFTSSLKTSNANFALNSEHSTVPQLGLNIGSDEKTTFSNFAHIALLQKKLFYHL